MVDLNLMRILIMPTNELKGQQILTNESIRLRIAPAWRRFRWNVTKLQLLREESSVGTSCDIWQERQRRYSVKIKHNSVAECQQEGRL